MATDTLLDLALQVADGTPVEWDTVQRRTPAEDRPVVERLRQLADLSAVHAKTDAKPRDNDAESPSRWGFLEILERIGRGSYGDVYRAHDPRLGRDVALKLLRQTDADNQSLLIREGHLLAKVRHPNVVTVYGAERIGGRTGVWMELVRGETLEEQLRGGHRFSAEEIHAIGIDLCHAIHAVHAAGLLHRDIKAQNVIRADDGRLVLMDFGTGVEGRETSPRLAGTPAYLAPEILFGSTPSSASEVYALGVLLFHLATGQFPVDGKDLSSLEIAHRHLGPSPVAHARPDFPPSLCAAIDRCLAPNPQARFPDVHDLENALAYGSTRRFSTSRLTIAAAALGGAILTAAVLFNVGGATRPGPKSVTLTQLSPELQQRATIRAPGWIGSRVTCSPLAVGAVALCDINEGSIQVLRKPASNAERSLQAFLSPDGELIAYVWFVQPSSLSVRLIRADGSQDRNLLGPDAQVMNLQGWTHDSTGVILLTSTRENVCRELVDIGTGARERLQCAARSTSLAAGSLSPDGRYLAYLKTGSPQKPPSDIWMLDRITGTDRPITTDDATDTGPLWTPDGTAIAFVSNRLGTWGLFTMAIENGGARGAPELVRDLGRSRAELMGFTHDGVLFLQALTDLEDVLHGQIDVAAHGLVNIGRAEPTGVDESSRSPDWSPDGQRFLLIEGAWRGDARIVIARSGRGVERTFTFDRPSRFDAVRWSPDGQLLAVLVNGIQSGPPVAIDLVTLSDGSRRRLFGSDALIRDIRWASDSGAIYYVSRGAVHSVDLAGASHEVYRPQSPWGLEPFSTFDVSTDGSLIVAARSQGVPCIGRIVGADGIVRDLASFKESCRSIAWGPGEQSVLAGVHDGNTSVPLFELPRDGSPPIRFASPRIQVVDIAVNPASGELLLGSGNPHPDVWMLSGFASAAR